VEKPTEQKTGRLPNLFELFSIFTQNPNLITMNRLISLLFIFTAIISFGQNKNESVFSSDPGNDGKWLLYKHNNEALYTIITNKAFQLLNERDKKIERLQTKEDWQSYQHSLKGKMFPSISKFERGPLNAQITGTLKRDNFTVEKILFESHPGFYVTAAMFLPKKRQNPAPCVIYCSGHSDLGFRNEVYQRVIFNLVEKGFIVFAFDPIGQGERFQYLDEQTGKSIIGGPTTEHSYAGVQTLFTGTSLADYFVWDGVRALDYLETRKEVDMTRIGITGRSGGGTQSAMIAAFDDRIYAAAPECYITNLKRLLQSKGPQDAEQNPYWFIKKGFDHPDFIHIRAPKPTLIVTTTHDFFSQQGARETFSEAQKSFVALGKPENIQFAEDMGKHESTKKNRETVYAFFQKTLNLPGDNKDVEIEPFTLEELWVTSTGQLKTSVKGKTVFDLNKMYFTKEELNGTFLKEKLRELSGVEFNRKLTAAVYTGIYKTENHEAEKYFLENDKNDFALPVYVIKNENPTGKVLIWVSGEGKKAILEHQYLNYYLKEGYTIVTADLPGTGELFDKEFTGDGFVKGVPFNYTFGANIIGKSIPGIQAEAIDLLVQFAKQKFANTQIDALTDGNSSTAMLVFASQKKVFGKFSNEHLLKFDQQFIETEFYDPEKAFHIIPGSLSYFDYSEASQKLDLLDN